MSLMPLTTFKEFDPDCVKTSFPIFSQEYGNKTLRYLDNAATTQVPQHVMDAVVKHETTCRSNVLRGIYTLAENATNAFHKARGKVADYLNADREEIIFTSGTTMSINLVANAFETILNQGDTIVNSLLEHHSNFVPWFRLKEKKDINISYVGLTDDGRLDLETLYSIETKKCKLIAITHISNVTGAETDIKKVVQFARSIGAYVFLDGAQRVAHGPLDIQKLGVDFYAFSGHKMFAPSGIGVLWINKKIIDLIPPFVSGGEMIKHVSPSSVTFADTPRRFEAGTPPIAQVIGLGAAIDWLNQFDWDSVKRVEDSLSQYVLDGLKSIKTLKVIGPNTLKNRYPVFSFTIEGLHPHDICQFLNQEGVSLRGGHHCAQPFMSYYDLFGTTRASTALYNNEEDIDTLIEGLNKAIKALT